MRNNRIGFCVGIPARAVDRVAFWGVGRGGHTATATQRLIRFWTSGVGVGLRRPKRGRQDGAAFRRCRASPGWHAARSGVVWPLGTPTERQRGQWYFQRYVAELPERGEIVLFDRSWYNRAGVEHVMQFCNEDEYREFLRSCPLFEEMLVRSGIYLVKYWFSINDEEQERRFQERIRNPIKRWKLSPMDIESRKHWVEYSKAKDEMFAHTDRPKTPWHVVEADNKKRARLNCIAHLLQQIPYRDIRPVEIDMPPRQEDTGYKRPKMSSQRFVPLRY